MNLHIKHNDDDSIRKSIWEEFIEVKIPWKIGESFAPFNVKKLLLYESDAELITRNSIKPNNTQVVRIWCEEERGRKEFDSSHV
jgi:hypothetical protein